MRKQLRQVMIEIEIVADDGADRRLHRLVPVAFGEMRLEPLLGLGRFHEHEAGRAAIGRGRAELQEIDDTVQQLVGDVAVLPGVMGARRAKQLVETGLGKSLAQTGRTSCTSGMKCRSRFSMP